MGVTAPSIRPGMGSIPFPGGVTFRDRWSEGGPLDDVVIALNFANCGYNRYTSGIPRAGQWRVRFNSDWVGYDPSFGNWLSYDTDTDRDVRDGLPAAANVGIGPYTALILSQDS